MRAPIPISGATRVCFIVGHPIVQVKSPSVFNEWTAEAGVDVVLLPLDVEEAGLAAFFAALRHWSNCPGCIVTYPHKQAAFAHLDEASEAAKFLQACNVVRREPDGRLVGSMTDGIGQIGPLRAKGVKLEGADFLLIGAGGAGSAIAYEAARAGAARIAVVELDEGRRKSLVDRLQAEFPAMQSLAEIPQDFRFDIACNASPVGMNGDPSIPYALDRFGPHTVVSDVVPSPAMTPWLEQARARGLTIQTGPEMVQGQFEDIARHLLPDLSVN